MIKKKSGTSYINVSGRLRKVVAGEVVKELDIDDIPLHFQDQWEDMGDNVKKPYEHEEMEEESLKGFEPIEVKLQENGKKVDIITLTENGVKTLTEKPLFKTHAMKMIAENGWVLVK